MKTGIIARKVSKRVFTFPTSHAPRKTPSREIDRPTAKFSRWGLNTT
jgi:hypothetical protein